ncbi:MAG: helix-turn-helix domain-containing protein [Spirochaetaceae bacterium]|jgi:transcriptional regulator with XRE-family HTH domain|nr:helix-turn-helix domain-containing protein [Spirochaetaceae bacterium]
MVENGFVEENLLVKDQVRRLAERLRLERTRNNLSQMELSFRAGLSQNMVNWIETGKISPTISTVFKLCNALCISPAVLFDSTTEDHYQARETVLNLVSKYM